MTAGAARGGTLGPAARTLGPRLPLALCLALAVLGSSTCSEDPATRADGDTLMERREPWTPELAGELRTMGRVDQEVREGFTTQSLADSAYMVRMMTTDSANSVRLQGLIADRAWPGASDIGDEAADAAFLIVQHTPFEDWQRSMLPHVERAVHAGELDAQSFALLYDRVQVKAGFPQKYGTQLHSTEDGRLRLDSLENPGAVDSLRAELGMPPLAEYLDIVAETYGSEVVR